MSTEEILESAPEIHLSASVSDLESMSSSNINIESLPVESVASQTEVHSVEKTPSSTSEPVGCEQIPDRKESIVQTESIEDGSHVLRIKIDLVTPLQTVLFYLILIFTLTYSIYRLVSVFSHIIPVEFFFMLLISIFGFLNFDTSRLCCLPFGI
jgi:hypothetical protein